MKAKILVILFLKSQEWLSIRSDHRSLGNLTATSVEVNWKNAPKLYIKKYYFEDKHVLLFI
jgi:hypothetical protein